MRFEPVPADRPPASTLIAEMVDEIDALYGGRLRRGPAADFSVPGGACLVGFDDEDRPVCVGGIKPLERGVGEIKRMYVVPEARGRGVARRLLGALEDVARELGYERLRLDTGPRQPQARVLYASAGYREIPDYNGNPAASFWGEKPLSSAR